MVVYKPSFANTKMPEYVPEHLVGRHLADDIGEVEEAFAQVLRDEIARQAVVEAFAHTADGVEGMRQGLVVADVADDHVVARDGRDLGRLDQKRLEPVDTLLVFRRDGDRAGALRKAVERDIGAPGDVGLVEHQDEPLVAAERQDLAGELGDLLGGFRLVDDPKHDLRLLQLLEGALDAEALDRVVGVADAGRVDETELEATDVDGVLDHVARSAVDVAHDGLLLVEQGVEQRRFAGVGLADDGNGNAVLDGVAHLE